MRYPDVEPQPSLPALEERVLAWWESKSVFAASIAAREAGDGGANEFVFYDGPPFANGLPHYGHLLTGFVKDAVPRYQTMRGRRVERRFGWDCHGLPAEVEAEKELGISGHPEINEFGVDRFNEACRTSVLRYTDEWHRYVTRQARWVDFDNDYKTLDLPYMESVMWAFKTLWDKGLIYEGFRVLAYCWRCETPLSNTETRMDDVYRQRQDPALTVEFALESGERLLAWTTTPWTLPANLALAVAPDVDYAVLEDADGVRRILAEARLGAYERELGTMERVGTVAGRDLVGRRYEPLFGYFAGTPGAHVVLGADFVTTEDGTGVVHMAPGFGEDDQIACSAAGIPTLCPMDEHGRYSAEISDWAGVHVFEANPSVIAALKQRGVVVRHETYDHPYPHCWRCAEPLVYRAVSSWFVEVTRFRDRMVEMNERIRWVPEHLKAGSFGKWIANARDWAISRNRFWGSPIPVWKSDDPDHPRVDVYGSLEELSRDFGVTVTDLHRPAIDELTRPNPDDPTGRSTMRRVPEVLDCWFESGSMPFAQVHYPFENQDWFENHFPGDFIVEYIGQTRGWFYTLHVLAVALFDRPAFSTCVSHGIVLGDDGQKMSKSLRNYPDPMAMFDKYGADAMRWYLLSSPILRGNDVSVTEEGIRETVRQVILPLWNSWYFLSLYANAESRVGSRRTDSANILDRYALAKLRSALVATTDAMDAHDLHGACAVARDYLDSLTNWYIRRSRERFWVGEQEAIDTLHTILVVLTRMLAPLLPLVSEEIHAGLHGGLGGGFGGGDHAGVAGADSGEAVTEARESVHLADWPSADDLPSDEGLVEAMDAVREVCSSALSVRKAHGLRVRQPLAGLIVAAPNGDRLAGFVELIADEVNVKSVTLTADVGSVASVEIAPVPARLGPRFGGRTQEIIGAIKRGEWTRDGESIRVGDVLLGAGEFTERLVVAEGTAAAALPGGIGVVLIDTSITEELRAEGTARDLIRMIQQARREAGFAVSDRVRVTLSLPESVAAAAATHMEMIAAETLADVVELDPGRTRDLEIEGATVGVHVGPGVPTGP